SRRRHTRFSRDWSSDVCSSDLAYVYDTVEFNERWQVTGGVRIERYDVEIDSNTADGQPQGPDAYDYGKTTVSGKLGLVYKPAEQIGRASCRERAAVAEGACASS